jgi:hypothetical protein
VQGVLLRLMAEQNEVSWTSERRRQDRRHRAWAWMLGLAATLLTAVDRALVWKIWSAWSND